MPYNYYPNLKRGYPIENQRFAGPLLPFLAGVAVTTPFIFFAKNSNQNNQQNPYPAYYPPYYPPYPYLPYPYIY